MNSSSLFLIDQYVQDLSAKTERLSATYTVHTIRNETGVGTIACHRILPGLSLLFNDFTMDCCHQTTTPWTDSLVEINHCRKGSYCCTFADKTELSMREGDLAINPISHGVCFSSFPIGTYEGISLVVDLSVVQQGLQAFPPDIKIDVPFLMNRIGYCHLRATAGIQQIFADLYERSPETERGLFLLKILELFFYLDRLPSRTGKQGTKLSLHQQDKFREIERYLVEDPERKICLCELCARFGIGMTSLKQGFKCLYGCPIATYRKTFLMQQAAQLLAQSDESITTIAGLSGYENPSKFASAFKSVMGLSPTQYRTARMEPRAVHSE